MNKTDSLPSFFYTCPTKKHFGIDCPGCGMQRAYYTLYKGDLKQSLQSNPAAIPFAFLLIFTLIHIKVKFRLGHHFVLWGFVTTAAIMVINFFVKLAL